MRSFRCSYLRFLNVFALAWLLAGGMVPVLGHVAHVENERIQLSKPHPDQAAIEASFAQAAGQYGVPVEILRAVAFVESRWVHTGPTVDYGYGIMHLVSNSDSQTLDEAAKLIGVSVDELKLDPIANINGSAAVIAEYVKNTAGTAKGWSDYWEALKRFSGLNKSVQEIQALEYFTVLANGATARNALGMDIRLAPVEGLDLEAIRGRLEHKAAKSDDYGPAIWNAADSSNYETTRYGTAIDRWVNHWVGSGTYAGAISWFKNPAANTSAHFVMRKSDGQLTQMVRIAHRAWHCGNWNSRSIGIEHEAIPGNGWPQDINAPMIVASADVCRHFCNVYGMPKNRTYIVGHNEVPGSSTACPGDLPWDVYITRVNNVPPSVTSNPSARTTCIGGSVQFSTSASGYGVSYRWQRNNTDIGDGGHFSGTGGTTLTVGSVDASVTGNYRCKISNFAGTVYSSAAALTTKAGTTVTANPTSVTLCRGGTAQFTSSGTGSGTVSIQWQKNGANLSNNGTYSGATTGTLTVSNVDANCAADYRAVITAECGSATTAIAQLSLKPDTAITQHPVDQIKCLGDTATFTAAGTGDSTLSYQWQKDGVDIEEGGHFAGVNSPALTVADIDGTVLGEYRCIIAGGCGSDQTLGARLTLMAGLQITRQPESVVAPLGARAQLAVAATGANLQFQWLKDAVPLSDDAHLVGTTTAVLNILSVAAGNVGSYSCQVSSTCGSGVSEAATLTLGASGPLGPTYQWGPLDINSGGAPVASANYNLISSTGQAGGVGPIEATPYLLHNGFWPVVLAGQFIPQLPDFDGDGDVDLDDFGQFQLCLTGSAPQFDPSCARARLDLDQDVDAHDLSRFRDCLSGANVSADPDCLQ